MVIKCKGTIAQSKPMARKKIASSYHSRTAGTSSPDKPFPPLLARKNSAGFPMPRIAPRVSWPRFAGGCRARELHEVSRLLLVVSEISDDLSSRRDEEVGEPQKDQCPCDSQRFGERACQKGGVEEITHAYHAG